MPIFARASKDGLTGLPDRDSFMGAARRIVSKSNDTSLSAVYTRLINLAIYNVRKGTGAGESVIRQVAATLRKKVPTNALGSLESGSFVAIMPTEEVEPLLELINKELPETNEIDGLELKAGYCEIRDDLPLEDAFLRARYAYEDIQFDSPVYSRFFDPGLETVYNRRAYVVEHLDDAIDRGEIRAYAQSIVRVLTGMICEVEILARWETEEFGFLRPDEFIPELERHQLIHQLDAEVIRLACSQWKEASNLGINVPFGINLSRLDFELCDIFSVVTEIMERYEVPVEQVHIEVTESALARSDNLLLSGIRRFRDAGFELYLDDFGSGYSSLQVLEGTSFDVVKLDMSLLREVEENERARVIVADAVSMVKRLNLQTLCEGVETQEQYEFLKAVGCEKAQGYYFGKPVSHEEIMSHLSETADLHETAEDQRYFDSIGRVNLIDGTRSSVHGVEAAHFLGTQPFALIEVRGQSISFLSANAAFNRFVSRSRAQTVDNLVEMLGNSLSSLRNTALYSTSKAISTKAPQRFDYVLEGNICTVGVSHVESSPGRDAFLVEILSITKYSQFNDFKLLEDSLRFLYSIFKRIDLLDVTDNTWRNIYLNVPRYNALRAGATPQDEIEAFCDTFIHPDDKMRFLEFYDLDTIDERIEHVQTAHLTDIFFALSDKNRYEDQLFMLIPVSMDGHKQYLSCMRDLDIEGLARQRAGFTNRVTDDILLSGILEVTERLVFWKDDQCRFLGANQRFLDYYGFDSIERILGKTDEDLGWTRNAYFPSDERRVLRGERVLDVKGKTVCSLGARSIRVSKMPLWREGKVIGMVGFLVDEGPLPRSEPRA